MWQDFETWKKNNVDQDDCEANSGAVPGYVEPVPRNARGFGRYKYRVIGRNGFACHHTNSMEDAEWYLGECRNLWLET